MTIRNPSISNSIFSNSNPAGNSVFNSRRRGFNRRVIVQQSSLKYQLKRFEIVVNSTYDNVITKAFKLYIEPLETGQYNLIPNSISTYLRIINTLKILSKIPEYEIIIKYILNAVIASRNIRVMYDNKLELENQIIELKKQFEDFRLGLNSKIQSSVSKGSISSIFNISLNAIFDKYFKIYGFSQIDTFRLQELEDDLISQGIDPYN
tara:strand:+ start:3310 stop:3930 length:621 start_codon:yes stop_codon:yes gene_type:complete